MKTKQCSRILFLLSCFWLLFPVNMVLSKPIQYSLDEHGLRLEGVGPDNPIIYDNDWWFDTPDKNYLWGMASLGKADLRANIVSRDMWNWQNGYLYKLEQGMKDARKSIEIARRSGVRNIPDAIAGCDCAFERPQSGRIEDTPIIPSKGSDVIVAEAQKATVQKPLLIFVGGPLNTIANAVLIDPSIADRIVVFMTDLRGYNGKDPWANFIVAKRCKLINYGAHIWWPQRPEPPVMPLERFKELPDNEQTRDLYRIAKWFWDRSTKDQPDRDDGFADGAPIFLVFQPKSWLQVKRQKITGIFTVQDVSNQSDYDLLDARELDYEGMTEAFFSCLKQASIYTHSVEPANRKSNPQVKAVLDYFYSLSDKSDERILSGQFTNFGTGSNLRIMEQIHDITGQWPALMGTDYADFRRGSITTKVPNAAAIEYWKQGGLVHVMAHMYNPANPKGGGLRDKGVDIADLLKEGTDTHTRWMEQLDLIAEGLLELKEAGVVVLWRPFHEMNGGWFWWGAQKPESFIAVWRHMFDYFSNTKGLDNLLWVYGPNHGNKTAAYYAGDDYVDLIGLDAYTDYLDPEHVRGYDEIIALDKPFGFSEYGPHASSNPPGDYDYRKFLAGVKENFPKTCYFMSWNAKWSLASNQYVKEMLSDPAIVNRDELPKELFSVRKPSAAANGSDSKLPVDGNWKVTFEDNFDVDKLDSSKWIPGYQWGQTHNYNAYCDPSNVLIENGLLRLKVEDKPSHDKKYTSAVVTTYDKFSQKYGYFEGRFRIPTGKGFWPAFWMLPYPQHWPPEIDIFETIRDDPKIYMTYHWSDDGKHRSSGKNWNGKDFTYSGDFHTYGLLWEPDKIVWYIDGIERSRFTDASVIVDEPMYLLINFGIDAKWPGPCDETTPFPAYYECDWVRVYRMAEQEGKQ